MTRKLDGEKDDIDANKKNKYTVILMRVLQQPHLVSAVLPLLSGHGPLLQLFGHSVRTLHYDTLECSILECFSAHLTRRNVFYL